MTTENITVLCDRIDYVAVWGHDDNDLTEKPCSTFEVAHRLVMRKKRQGFEVAYVREDPMSAIGEDEDDGPTTVRAAPLSRPERPCMPPEHPLLALANLLDDDCNDNLAPATLLAEIGTERLRELAVMAVGLLDPADARIAIARAVASAQTDEKLRALSGPWSGKRTR